MGRGCNCKDAIARRITGNLELETRHAGVPVGADATHRSGAGGDIDRARRFCKAYIGDPTERGQLPIYAEIQVPVLAGIHDRLLDEIIDCSAAVTSAFVDWLHDEGGLL